MAPSKIAYVTTFSRTGYANYGRRFLSSYAKFVSEPLYLVTDEEFNLDFKYSNIIIHGNHFTEKLRETYRNFDNQNNFRFSPNRFCYKTSAVETVLQEIPKDIDYLIWLDADSFIKQDDFTDLLMSLIPEKNQIASFFDRDLSYGYSETGIVIFNVKHSETANFVRNWNEPFVNGRIINCSEWHDAFYFSHLVRGCPPGKFRHLCSDLKLRSKHPIYEYKQLRKRIEHLKGNTRKALGFSPEKYYLRTNIINAIISRWGKIFNG